jgi:hypothetical protein
MTSYQVPRLTLALLSLLACHCVGQPGSVHRDAAVDPDAAPTVGMDAAPAADAASADVDAAIESSYTVGGTVTGLSAGSELHLVLNGIELVTLTADDSFTFATNLAAGASYMVSLLDHPDQHLCTLSAATGTITDTNVTDVDVQCAIASAALSSLTASDGLGLSPTFSSTHTTYTVQVHFAVTELRLTPTAIDPNATILVDGVPVTSGTSSQLLPLDLGDNLVAVQVMSPDVASLTYFVVVTRSDLVLEQTTYVKASNSDGYWDEWGWQGDQYGYAVAISGDTLVVGANIEASTAAGIDGDQTNNQVEGSGAVYVYRRTNGVWAQEAYLKPSNSSFESEELFGESVAIDGDTVVVGAPGEESSSTGIDGDQSTHDAWSSGAVYVFQRAGSSWTQQAYIKASNTGLYDWFGMSVALSGDTLAVGAPHERSSAIGIDQDQANDDAYFSGAVYVFQRTGSIWTQQAYIKASNTDAYDHFGMRVALSGDTLAVGAPGEQSASTGIDGDDTDNSALRLGNPTASILYSFGSTCAPNSASVGAVYVFERTGSTWAQQAYIKPSTIVAGAEIRYEFGTGLAIDGDTLAVGAPGESSDATTIDGDETNIDESSSGAAYVFVRSDDQWQQQAYVKASNAETYDLFGFSVALSGNELVVGAPAEDGAYDQDGFKENVMRGAAYLFRRSSTTWTEVSYLTASNAADDPDDEWDFYGHSLAFSDGILAVGAPLEASDANGVNGDQTDNTAPSAGAVYLLEYLPPP